MSKRLLAISAFAAAAVIAACGGGAPTGTGRPGTSVAIPSLAIPSIAIPSIAVPSISVPSISIPSIVVNPDTDLQARFPATVPDGEVGEVSTGNLMAALISSLEPQQQQQITSTISSAGMDPNALAYGSQTITMNQNNVVQLEGIRTPGGDANRFIAIWPQLAQMVEPDESPDAVSQGTVGDKQVVILTSPEGVVSYLYATGDVGWRLTGADETEAAAIFDAIR